MTTPRGFSRLTPEQRRHIASQGGKAAHAAGKAHRWSSDAARQAGRIGGAVTSRNVAFMSAIGRKGGAAGGRRSAEVRRARKGAQA